MIERTSPSQRKAVLAINMDQLSRLVVDLVLWHMGVKYGDATSVRSPPIRFWLSRVARILANYRQSHGQYRGYVLLDLVACFQ